MTDAHSPDAAPADNAPKWKIGQVWNSGEPIKLTDINLAGVTAEPARGGEQVKVWARLGSTSDEPLFHRIAEELTSILIHAAQQAGTHVNFKRAEMVLLVIKADHTAELWVDTAAVSLQCIMKRPIAAGRFVFESDVADITGMNFPCVTMQATDRVLCLFRESWSFGLYYDFTGTFDSDLFSRTLGTQVRTLRYRHLYEAMADHTLVDRLTGSGWFPFVEIITSEFKDLVGHCESGFDLADAEAAVIAKFDQDRVQRLYERWIAKPHFASKAALLEAAIKAYKATEPISVIKILLTEIEGILNEAYKTKHGKGAKLKELLQFAVESAEKKVGQPDTMLFPAAFARFIAANTFANFDPANDEGGAANSRHAVGHGAAKTETYTMVRALQAILTLDQIAFYT